jgi:hypothetical protein
VLFSSLFFLTEVFSRSFVLGSAYYCPYPRQTRFRREQIPTASRRAMKSCTLELRFMYYNSCIPFIF